jgi:general secretion pathway protein A
MDFSSESPKANTEQRARQVRRILGELAAQKRIILILDEAQRLSLQVLEQLKTLTEMTWGFRSRLVTVLLIGQPELMSILMRDKGLYQRVTSYQVRGFSEDETLQYIDQRCRAAGGCMEDIFDAETLKYLAENLHTPLHINHVCSTCMRAAKHAGESIIKINLVYECSGIRSPRQVLRDAGLTINKLAGMVGVRKTDAAAVLNGDGESVDPTKRAKILDEFRRITRGEAHKEERKTA